MLFFIYTVIPGYIIIFAINALTRGLEATTKILSLHMLLYQDNFHKKQKDQKSAFFSVLSSYFLLSKYN